MATPEEVLANLQRPCVTDEAKEAIRNAAFAQSFQYSIKPRFGLFSQPVSNAIGETNKFPKKKANLDEDGKVIIGPRNFYGKKAKRGKDDSVYFSRQSYIAVGDMYKQQSNVGLRTVLKDGHIIKGKHDMNFRPARAVREKLYQTKYENMPLKENSGKEHHPRDEDGKIIIAPRNFTTIPMKKGKVGKLTTFSGPIAYVADPYDNKKKIAWAELKAHQALVQEKPFSQQARRITQFGTFCKPKEVYGNPLAAPAPRRRTQTAQSAAVLPDLPGTEPLHDKAFKPAGPKKGVHPTIGGHPGFMANPPTELKRKVVVEGEEEDRPRFKLTYNLRSRPTPSVATNYRNLKASYPMAFSGRL